MSEQSSQPEKGAFLTSKNILAIIIVVASLVFIFTNFSMAKLNLFGLSVTMPAWIWLVVLLGIGFVVGSLFPWFKSKKK
ncbi:MAG: LapA family protein [Actinobacteria bacterium]|nr:LapA family protein [Actinomycetota bacterium]